MPMTKEERADYMKKWRLQNKEKIAAYAKTYREEHKEERAAKKKEYRLTPEGIKSEKISHWKQQGMVAVDDNWDIVYETYIIPLVVTTAAMNLKITMINILTITTKLVRLEVFFVVAVI